MLKHYYSTGNGGAGTEIYAFTTKAIRDDFVAWSTKFNQRRAITRADAKHTGKKATLLVDGSIVPDGYGPTTIDL